MGKQAGSSHRQRIHVNKVIMWTWASLMNRLVIPVIVKTLIFG